HMLNGDIVLFNRQPSLHKMSMMGHIIKVIPDPSIRTYGMNVNVCGPYNADFDGDEMNLYNPQSIQAQIELRLIAAVEKCFVSPATSEMSIKATQDTVLGAYIITMKHVYLHWQDAMNILMNTTRGFQVEIPKGKM